MITEYVFSAHQNDLNDVVCCKTLLVPLKYLSLILFRSQNLLLFEGQCCSSGCLCVQITNLKSNTVVFWQ